MNNESISAVTGWTDAMNRHDPDAAASYLDRACVFTNIGTGQRLVGRAAVRDDLADLFGRWTDLHIQTTNLLVSGAGFAKEWVMTGVHSGDLPGLSATGRSFRIMGTGVGRTADGKIIDNTEYWNMVSFLTQVGVFPAPT